MYKWNDFGSNELERWGENLSRHSNPSFGGFVDKGTKLSHIELELGSTIKNWTNKLWENNKSKDLLLWQVFSSGYSVLQKGQNRTRNVYKFMMYLERFLLPDFQDFY